MITAKIENVVATASISKFDTKEIIYWPMVEFRPNGYPGICVHVKNITLSIFDSGKIVSKGSKDPDIAINSILNFIKRLKKSGLKVAIKSKPVINMIVSHVNLAPKILDITRLKELPEFHKEIKRFACLQLKFKEGNVQVYKSKLVISTKRVEDINLLVKKLRRYTC